MTKHPFSQSQKRSQESLGSLFHQNDDFESELVFLKSSSDIGVQRNGGRNGACFAPQSFLSYFKKLNIKPAFKSKRFTEYEVASVREEREDFHKAQSLEADRIFKILSAHPSSSICHLGGGHDHIYPLLEAYGRRSSKIIVINIDAHADTRIDEEFHSGTPFRQFANKYSGEFHLYQTGLLEFANSESTLSPLSKGKSKILWKQELSHPDKVEDYFNGIRSLLDSETTIIFSLDADAINGADMPGVSAVNGHGLSREELQLLWSHYRSLAFQHAPIVGFYELNPVYDTLSMMSMRTMGSFLYEILE